MLNKKQWDYITTIAGYIVPLVIANQVAIMAQVPQEYSWIAAIIFGVISQYATNKRVEEAREELPVEEEY